MAQLVYVKSARRSQVSEKRRAARSQRGEHAFDRERVPRFLGW